MTTPGKESLPSYEPWQGRATRVGFICLGLWLVSLIFWRRAAYQGYWFAWVCLTGLGLGFMALSFLQFLTRGAWSHPLQRPAEAGAMALPLMALLFVPMLFGMRDVFPWVDPASFHAAPHQRAYLTVGGFLARSLLTFAILVPLTVSARHWSLREDARVASELPRARLRALGAGGLVAYSITMLFVSTDWVMSLQPGWYSTMLVVIVGIAQLLAALAACIAILPLLSQRDGYARLLHQKSLRDLGNLLLALVIFWTYVTFSQYLIIWSGNLPREIGWYLVRSTTGWKTVALCLALFQFAIPFAILLFRRNKDSVARLSTLAGVVLLMSIVHVYWLVAPAFGAAGSAPLWTGLLALAGMGGLWISVFLAYLRRRPLVPAHAEKEVAP